MKKIFITLIFCGLTFIVNAQNASVEQTTFGIQTGLLGIWAHNELKLSNQVALRSELGLDVGFWGSNGNHYAGTGFLLVPTITLEPRWYYNLNNRARKMKNIDGNNGTFLSIKTTYRPDWFVISNRDNINILSDISIVPTLGIRRNIGKHFTYETGIGIGYLYTFAKNAGYSENYGDAALNIHLRVGYRF